MWSYSFVVSSKEFCYYIMIAADPVKNNTQIKTCCILFRRPEKSTKATKGSEYVSTKQNVLTILTRPLAA